MHARSLRWLFAFALLICQVAVAQQSVSIASQIALLNRSLESRPRLARPSRSVASPNLLNVLQVRQKLVEQLIETDPGLVRSVMLPSAVAAQLSSESPEYAAAIESDTNWSGTLSAAVADDFEHGISTTHWYLQSGDHRIELFFANNQNPMQHIHRSVSVRGVATPRVMSVEGLRAEIKAQANPPGQNCNPTGVENIAVLLMNQPTLNPPTQAVYPATTSFGTTSYWTPNYFGSTAPSTNNYWQETSFSLTSGTGTVYGPLTLTSTHDCSDTDAMEADAIAAAKANGIDFSSYSRVSIIFPVQSCTFGGLGTIGCNSPVVDPNLDHAFSVNWIPVASGYPASQVLWGVLTHELGHNLGLNHSSSVQFENIPLGAIDYTEGATASTGVGVRTEYGDPYTIMGNGSYNCFGQYTAFNKAEYLTWLNRTSDINEVTTGGSFKILPFENSSGLRALRVLRDPLTSSWLWMEYRQALGQYDSDLGGCVGGGTTTNILEGANVYYESPYSQDGHVFLLDMNVSNSNAFDIHNGALTPGTSWSDPYSLLTLTVPSNPGGADSSGIKVNVSYDQPCASLSISNGGVFDKDTTNGGVTSGSINVTAPNTCAWTASTVDNWITINSGASGTGNGTVSFSLASNASTSQRNGYITVQRQSVPVAQKGKNTFVGNLNPTLQSGFSGVPVFTFTDPAGVADISYVTMKVHGSDCEVEVTQSSGTWYMFLLDPVSNNFSSALIPGTPGSTSNLNCTLNSGTSTVSSIGNQFQIGLGLTFANSFAGSYRVTASACDGTGCSADIPIGVWSVGPAPSISGLSVTSGKQGASVPITITGANTHFSGSSTVTVSGGGITASSISAGSNTQLGATLTIDPNTTASTRTLTVNTGFEVITSSFTVNSSGQAQISSANLTFAAQNLSTTSSTQPVTLTNNGHAALNITSISASSDFGVSHNCGTTLAVGFSCTLNITFTPTVFGTRTGTVTVVDDAPSSPQTIALSGLGNAIIAPSRPSRPTLSPSASAHPGTITHAIFTLGDFHVTSASDLVCQGSRRLTCSIEPAESADRFRVAIDATLARPGRYVLHVSAPNVPRAKAIAIPVLVKSKAKQARQER